MKKLFALLLVLLVLTSTVFAEEIHVDDKREITNKAGTVETNISAEYVTVVPTIIGGPTKVNVYNPFAGAWGFYLQVVIAGIGGSLMLLRFATELVGAVIYEGEDSTSKVRQVIVRFLVHVGVAAIGFIAISFIVNSV